MLFLLSSNGYAQFFGGPFGDSEVGDVLINKHSFGCQELDTTPSTPNTDNLKFYCKDNAGTTALYTLDSTGTETLLGSGSGTISDGTSGQLAVYTDTNTIGSLGSPSLCSAGSYPLGIDSSGNATGCTVAGGSAAGGLNAVQYNSPLGTFAGNESVFSMNGTNVGIGTTNGTQKLDVRGRIVSSDRVTATNLFITGDGTSAQPSYVFAGSTNTGSYAPAADVFGVSVAGSEKFRINSNGNVGIGTVDTARKFVVQAAANENFRLRSAVADGLTTGIRAQSLTNAGVINYLRFDANPFVVQGGNVGIGTEVPPNVLYVAGTGEMNGFKLNGQGGGAGNVLVSNTVGIGTWMSPNTLPTGVGGSGTVSSGTADRVAIYDAAGTTVTSSSVITDDNTNVGISSTAPGQKLDVVGQTRTWNVGISSVNGGGYIDLVAQASNPSAPAAGVVRLHTSTNNGFTRLEQDNEATTNLFYGRDNAFIAKNTSGGTINKGQVAYATGSTGAIPTVSLAKADSTSTLPAIGVAVDNVSNNAFGLFMNVGIIDNLDTSAFSTGAAVFVSATTAGNLTATRPSGTTNSVQRIGSVLNSGVGNGSLLVLIAPAVLNMETGTNAAYWTASRVGIGTTLGNGSLNVMNGNVGIGTWNPNASLQVKGGELVIPSGANPSVTLAGSISVDTSTGGNMLRFFGDAERVLPARQSKSFVITGATAAGDFGNVWRVPFNSTIAAVHCLAVGGTNVVGQLQECDSNGLNCADVDSDMTCTAATNVNDDGTLSNPTLDAGDYLGVKTTSVSGTNTNITWTFEYMTDPVN
jgi:hypothetical protein